MINARILEGVHTSNLVKIKRGKKNFINDE
jgi:hypothetical protein